MMGLFKQDFKSADTLPSEVVDFNTGERFRRPTFEHGRVNDALSLLRLSTDDLSLFMLQAFNASGRHCVKMSSTLAEMLFKTELNIPILSVRAPHPCICIQVPESVIIPMNTPSESIGASELYVMCDIPTPEEAATKVGVLNVMGAYYDENVKQWGRKLSLRLLIDTKSTDIVEQLVTISLNSRAAEFISSSLRLALNLFMYMSQPREECDVEFKPDTRMVAAKKMPRGPQRDATEANFYRSKASQVYIVGFKTEEELKRLSAAYEHQGGTKRPHWRRGHWQRFWTGPRDQPELRKTITRWVKPMIVAAVEGVEAPPTTYVVE